MDKIYDIGLVCMMNLNIGNNLTNYALYQYLSDLGYKVLLISTPLNVSFHFPNATDDRFKRFQALPYRTCDISEPVLDKWQLSNVNHLCEKFVLGSDQLWRDKFVRGTDYFTCLDWVESGKYKVAYGTSFGTSDFDGDSDMRQKMGYLLKRFQKISVREPDGVNILNKLYGIEAIWVLDPVFICEKKYYENMAETGMGCLPDNKFIGAYLLDITEEKESAVLNLAKSATNGIYMAMSQPDGVIGTESRLSLKNEPSIEEWLAMTENCDFFITDSFHGLCFALVFEKQFCVIFDRENWRGLSRIRALLNLVQLESRLIERYEEEEITRLYEEKIDFGKVNAILDKERERSKNWLLSAVEEGKHYQGQYDEYDYIWKLSGTLKNLQTELSLLSKAYRINNYRNRNSLFLLEHSSTGKIKRQIAGWGAGECFKRNINFIQKFYDMKYVCDSNPQKWGQKLKGNVTCISPRELKEMENVVVIIMVDCAGTVLEIADKLRSMGINNIEHVENWLAFVKGA